MYHELLDRPIAYHRVLAEIAGSVGGGVFLSQALYWSKRTTLPDGWFYKTSEEWFEETYLSRREQETVRKRLVAINIIDEVKRGVPAKLHFRLNVNVLEEQIRNVLKRRGAQGGVEERMDVQTSLAESAKLDSTKAPNKDGGKRQTNTETTSETSSETTENISVDLQFEEFWAAYPPKPANPRKKAKDKYMAIRKQKVSHETIVNAAKKYAAMRAGEDPKFTAQAVTWLNQWRFEDDYEVGGRASGAEPTASDEDFDKLVAVYPGHVGDRERAKKILKSEMAKGVDLSEICGAAEKYSLFCKGNPYENRRITPSMLEPWLQFKWREMDAYEVCRVGADRIKTVRAVKVKP